MKKIFVPSFDSRIFSSFKAWSERKPVYQKKKKVRIKKEMKIINPNGERS
jgi:hypothetical protein